MSTPKSSASTASRSFSPTGDALKSSATAATAVTTMSHSALASVNQIFATYRENLMQNVDDLERKLRKNNQNETERRLKSCLEELEVQKKRSKEISLQVWEGTTKTSYIIDLYGL